MNKLFALLFAAALVVAGCWFFAGAAQPSPAGPLAAPLFAVKPDAAFALVAVAISLLAVRALARNARSAAAIALHAIDRMIAAVFPAFRRGRCLGVSAYTQIADLWVPDIWKQGQLELQVNKPNIFRSPLITSGPLVKEAVNGAGMLIHLPFIKEPRPVAQPQRERVAPDITKLGSGQQLAAIVNRVSPLGGTALAKQISGADPLTAILSLLDNIRTYQFQTALISQLTGLFALAGGPNVNAGAFKALRTDHFLEDGGTPLNGNLISSSMMLYAVAKMGQKIEQLVGGYVFMHTDIMTSLNDQDQIDVIKNSEGVLLYRSWKGMIVVVDDSLVRPGGASGNVYTTLICAPASVIFEQKPQVFTDRAGEVAAVQVDLTQIATNDVVIYDRTRYCLHPQGAKWTPQVNIPTYADAGPIDAEFADPANWALAFGDVKNTGIVALRTNG